MTPLFAGWLGGNLLQQPRGGPHAGGGSDSRHRRRDAAAAARLPNDDANPSPSIDNFLFRLGLLSPASAVLELGCGVSGLVGLVVSPRVARYVLTDQAYVGRWVETNLRENGGGGGTAASSLKLTGGGGSSADADAAASSAGRKHHARKTPPAGRRADVGLEGGAGQGRRARTAKMDPGPTNKLFFRALDWETDIASPFLLLHPDEPAGGAAHLALDGGGSFDVVVACDCVYNEALVAPLVRTCVDTCRLRGGGSGGEFGGGGRLGDDSVQGLVGHLAPSPAASPTSTSPHHGRPAGGGPKSASSLLSASDAVSPSKSTTSTTVPPPPPQPTATASPIFASTQASTPKPCVCVVAQQLRDPAVFEAWLRAFDASFHVWRVPDAQLTEGLRSSDGFVVHVGFLR